jgi:glyoxylase-like metal-dependent hydrolase (beta-lactamase superfamily II)
MILTNPDYFAFAMPISGNRDEYLGDYAAWAALKNMPIFFVHSQDDPITPVEGSLNAITALQHAGNHYADPHGVNPCIWSTGSVHPAHDAWWTAFHKFEVVYNAMFQYSRKSTNYGKISPNEIFSKRDLGNGITTIWDYAQSTVFVVEGTDKAIIIDCAMGHSSIYQFIKDNVLRNKNIDIEIFLTHDMNDHIAGLPSFIGASQLKKVYIHEAEKTSAIRLLGPDAGKVQSVNDGDKILFGNDKIEIIHVPGHSAGSIVFKYKQNLFTGDAVGTGYLSVNSIPIEEYVPKVQHLLDKMGDANYIVYGGHSGECRVPLSERYVHDMYLCAKNLVDGTVETIPYWRRVQPLAMYGDANLYFNFNNIHTIKGALSRLTISEGTLNEGRFSPATAFYTATIGKNVPSIDIIPTVKEQNYRALTINGNPIESGKPYKANLLSAESRFSIAVTASDNTTRVYTLTVTRGK